MSTATAVALLIPVILVLLALLGKLNFIYRLVKAAVIVGVGYMVVVLAASVLMPGLAEKMLEPLRTLWDLAMTFLRELRI